MNTEMFHITGYISVLLWLLMLVCWGLHRLRGPRGVLLHLALVLGIASYVLAKHNSLTHVNRIRIDPSAELARQAAQQEAARQAAQEARGEDVAQVRFAEDGANDFLDVAGMDEADRKYYLGSMQEKTGADTDDPPPTEATVPAWKREKRTRSESAEPDDSLEAMIDTTESEGGMDVEAVEEAAPAEPIYMAEAEVIRVNRLDGFNLALIRWLVLINLLLLLTDYLRRRNIYHTAYLPLPLPSAWGNAFTPLPVFATRPDPPRRSILKELAWITRRGEVFLYITDDPERAAQVPETLFRLPLRQRPVEVLHVDPEEPLIDDAFVFEALWFGRASFVVDSGERADALLHYIVDALKERADTRARTRQTVHLVWDGDELPDELKQELVRYGRDPGWALMVT